MISSKKFKDAKHPSQSAPPLPRICRAQRSKAEKIRVREKIDTNELVKKATQGLTGSGIVENVEIEIVDRDKLNGDAPSKDNTSGK